jgi:hypothetical protein
MVNFPPPSSSAVLPPLNLPLVSLCVIGRLIAQQKWNLSVFGVSVTANVKWGSSGSPSIISWAGAIDEASIWSGDQLTPPHIARLAKGTCDTDEIDLDYPSRPY